MSQQLAEYLRFALDWIDAIPDDIAASLPAMPGFDRDIAEAAIEDYEHSRVTEVIGYTTDQLVEAMGTAGIHCSLSKMKEFAIELQSRALAEQARRTLALERMVRVSEELGLYDIQPEAK